MWDKLFGEEQEFKIIIIGLDNAGKTTILEWIKTGEMEKVVPTIGYEYQELWVKNLTLKVWDLSGQQKFRTVWKHYYVDVCGIVFVIDSTDLEKMETAWDEIHHLLAE